MELSPEQYFLIFFFYAIRYNNNLLKDLVRMDYVFAIKQLLL